MEKTTTSQTTQSEAVQDLLSAAKALRAFCYATMKPGPALLVFLEQLDVAIANADRR
jgi:hypothetical protein